MKIGIIGAGFTGLSSAYHLAKAGHKVEIFETYKKLGGLAACENINGYKLERYYHHIFQTDKAIIQFAKHLGVVEKLKFRKSYDGIYADGKIYPLISPTDIFCLSFLSIPARLRLTAATLYLKLKKNCSNFEGKTAKELIIKTAGHEVYTRFWLPLFVGKFGQDYYQKISACWFWARVKFRTQKLGYFDGGFETLAQAAAKEIKRNSGQIYLGEPAILGKINNDKIEIQSTKRVKMFDKVIYTGSLPTLKSVFKELPSRYLEKLTKIKFLNAQCLILIAKKSLTPYYWLNIADASFPFMLVVEQTNFVPVSHYNGKRIIYIGNYLKSNDWRWLSNKNELIERFMPFIKKLNPSFQITDIEESYLFRGSNAQPIVTTNYQTLIPEITTPFKNLYLATMAQVYPFDRGTNYAVELGKKAAEMVMRAKN